MTVEVTPGGQGTAAATSHGQNEAPRGELLGGCRELWVLTGHHTGDRGDTGVTVAFEARSGQAEGGDTGDKVPEVPLLPCTASTLQGTDAECPRDGKGKSWSTGKVQGWERETERLGGEQEQPKCKEKSQGNGITA